MQCQIARTVLQVHYTSWERNGISKNLASIYDMLLPMVYWRREFRITKPCISLGNVGWGITWYINGLLVPEITVVRGRTYLFVVEGGSDPENPARFHPFYITDDREGGYQYKTRTERQVNKTERNWNSNFLTMSCFGAYSECVCLLEWVWTPAGSPSPPEPVASATGPTPAINRTRVTARSALTRGSCRSSATRDSRG